MEVGADLAAIYGCSSAVRVGFEATPLPQERPRVNAGGVAVVPDERDAPCAHELRVLGPQGERGCWLRPHRHPSLPQPTALGAGAVHSQLLERVARGLAVGPGGGEADGPV